MKYDVHVFPIVRVTIRGIEASSQEEAMVLADKREDFHSTFDHLDENIEYAEDVDGYYVDEVGDEEYENSTWYDKHHKPLEGR